MKKAFQPRISAGLVLTMALALFNLGLFAFLLLAGEGIQRKVKEDFEIQVFLDKNLLPEQVKNIEKAIQALGLAGSQKDALRFVSKEESGKLFIAETGEEFIQFLGENPLRDAYHLKVKEAVLNPAALSRAEKKLSEISGVFEVYYLKNLADSLHKNLRNAGWFFLFLTGILFLTVFWLLRSSIRSAVHSGRFFIRSMELLGASSWFIRRPYVLAIGMGGLLGGVFSAVMLTLIWQFASKQFPEISPVLPVMECSIICASLIPAGFLLSFLPALGGIRAYQRKKLSELHS